MRPLYLILPFAALTGCMDAPSPNATAVAAPAAPFVVPMDPGQITCAQLSNPNAQAEAVEWVLGQARAAVLAGRAASVPAPAAVQAQIISACQSTPDARLASVARQIGL